MKTTTFKLEKKNGSYLTFSFNHQDRALTVERAAFKVRTDQYELVNELCRYFDMLKVMRLRCRSHFPLSLVKDLDCCTEIDDIVD